MSTRGVRRLGGLCAGVALVSLALVAAAVVTAVGDRHAVRIDVTSGGSQRLSPRTEALIDQISLLGGAEVVVVADMATIDPRARRTVRDVLDLLGHAGDVRTVEIDAGSSGGQAEFDALIARLVERDRDEIEAYGAALGRAGEAARAAAAEMTGGLSRLLGEVRAGLASPAPDILSLIHI